MDYKDELLQEKIDELDDLDKIQLQNKVIYKETVLNGLRESINTNFTLTYILLGVCIILTATLKNLQFYGLNYDTHLLLVIVTLIFVFIFTALSWVLSIIRTRNSKRLQENIDEFIKENTA